MTRNGEDVTGNCCPWQGKRIKPGSRVALNLQSRSPKAVIASQNRTPLIFGMSDLQDDDSAPGFVSHQFLSL